MARGWARRVAADSVASWGHSRDGLVKFIRRDGKSVLEGASPPKKQR